MELCPVQTAEQRWHFLELPARLHAGHPHWVSASGDQEAGLAGFAEHPFYAAAEAQAFLAIRDGIPVGRILAIDNIRYRQWRNESTGFFGFFECADDRSAARGLVTAASEWLADRKLTGMRGPLNPSVTWTCGCLVEGYDRRPTSGMPWNPDWYGGLLEAAGLRPARDLLSFTADVRQLSSLQSRLYEVADRTCQRFNIRVRQFEMDHFDRDLHRFFEVYNRSITHQYSSVPAMEGEIRLATELLRPVTDSPFTALAESNGQPVGAVLGFPDLNSMADRESLEPERRLRYSPERQPAVRRIRLAVTVVVPEFQRWGVGLLMHVFMLRQGLVQTKLADTVRDLEYSWILENNRMSRAAVEKGGAVVTRKHRIYEMPIGKGMVVP